MRRWDKDEDVVAVHTDRAHVHVHIIFNSVSFLDGKKSTRRGANGYQRGDIQHKLNGNPLYPERARGPDEILPPADETLEKFIGMQAEYYNFTQQMRRLITRQHLRYSPALRTGFSRALSR